MSRSALYYPLDACSISEKMSVRGRTSKTVPCKRVVITTERADRITVSKVKVLSLWTGSICFALPIDKNISINTEGANFPCFP